MMKTQKLLIYASGSEKNAPEGFTSWRDKLKTDAVWNDDKIKIVDPMEHFNYDDKSPVTSKQTLNYFMWLIDRCDVLLVNLDHSDVSVGTGYEVQHAFDVHKPIVGFGTNPETWYEWNIDRCEIIFKNMDDAIYYIYKHYVEL